MATEPPQIQVSHLPSAASFYCSLTQPLGLQFLSATPTVPACLHFGYILSAPSGPRKITVFTVSQAAPPRLSHITLSAPSPKAVFDFHGQSGLLSVVDLRGQNKYEKVGEEQRALTRDFDGNVIEAVYGPVLHGSGVGGSLGKESKRVLEWQQDVARSISGSDAGAAAVFGTLLGAAAGAAFAYAMTRSESTPSPSPSTTGRRASAPQYTHEPIVMEDREPVAEAKIVPATSHFSERELTPRCMQYAIAAPPMPAPSRVKELAMIEERSHVSQKSHRSSRSKAAIEAKSERALTVLSTPREGSPGSHVSHRSHRSGTGSSTGSERERRREAGREKERERGREKEAERGSEYLSARSHHSVSTVKPAPPAAPQPPSAAGSRASTARPEKEKPRSKPRSSSGSKHSHHSSRRSSVSARHVPLPPSVVDGGGVTSGGEGEGEGMGTGLGYAASVAPSDSVSSVGIKRERERLAERMHFRERARGVLWGHS
ncbi:glyoxalase family protein [Diplocarpon rosae]|nr:glyoxalase family protein [Diplocarpon rosae]